MAIKESSVVDFSIQEKIFKEKTGKDFSFFYQKYYPKLIYYTNKMVNDQQKAEDISTDSFLVAFEKIDKYENGKSQFSTWLFTIAKNLALQVIKDDKKTMSMDVEIDEEGTTIKDFIQEEAPEDDKESLYEIKGEIMLKHIAELKEPYRQVIEMREIQEMSYKEIAEKLNLNESTLKSRIRNGRILLKKSTEKEFKKIDPNHKYEIKKIKKRNEIPSE
jgi:RNA polymerase sigma-70 factor (ECF subfamily)